MINSIISNNGLASNNLNTLNLSISRDNTCTLVDEDSFFIRHKDNDAKKISEVFLNKKDFDIFILFLINKGIIDMEEFKEFKQSINVFNKLDQK